MTISIPFALLGIAVCCTIVLFPFGLLMFTGATSLGAVGLNLILDKSVWVPASREAELAHKRLARRNKRMK
jgi:hypothetical protein